MFEINSYILQKMGWTKYCSSFGLGQSYANLFNDDRQVRYFLIDKERGFVFIIKEMTPDEKQKSNSEYKFIRFNLPENVNQFDFRKLKFKIDNFSSNVELIKLIISNEAGDEQYRRHFKLIKIFK
jgi:thiamine pyrophosphokinase